MGELDIKDRDAFPVLGVPGDGGDSGADVRATEDWVYDTDGSDATDDTLVGDIDGRSTTLGGLKNYIAEGSDPKNKLNSTSVAQAFDADEPYTTGTYVTYEGVLYKFIADHAAGVSWADSASLVETAVVMEPDATIDVVDGKLQVKNANGVVIWEEKDPPVTSVNSKTGAVVLNASDVGALGTSGQQTLNGNLTVNGSLTSTGGSPNDSITFYGSVIDVNKNGNLTHPEWPDGDGKMALVSQIPDISGLATKDELKSKADSAAIDAEYDDSDTYAEGDTCMHDGKWYSCNTDISDAEEWTPAHWTEQTVQDAKLDSTSAAPAFDPTQSYSVNEYVTYNGALYVCSASHAAAPWNPAHFSLTDMVTPDATLDVTSANALRVVSADGEVLWMQGYNLESTSATTPAVTLSNESVNYYASPANSPDTVALTLPAITTNPPKVSDFILDVDNPALTKVYGDGTTTVAAYNSASTYAVDDTVSYGGSVWKCNTASTTGDWNQTYWDYVAEYILQYSTSATYNVGDRVLYTDSGVVKIYTCNTASTTGTWDPTKWNLFGYYIPMYDTASTYAEGAKVIYGDALYSCNTAGTTGTWDATKWNEQILTLSLGTALDNTMSVVIADGDDLGEMFTIGWGEKSEFYFTLTAFKVNGKPTYKIIKQVVVNGGAA